LQGKDIYMKKAIVIGSGAGGATAAKELQGKFQVTVLESGGQFSPLRINLSFLQKLRSTNLFFTEKMIQLIVQSYRISKTRDAMVLVHGAGIGGTTTVACGNALRTDEGLKRIGIDLDKEFEELEKEIPITIDHRHLWRKQTHELFSVCEKEGLNPFPVPKAGNYKKCRNCGQCTLGCQYGTKWDSSVFINEARAQGAQILRNCTVKKISYDKNRAAGVLTNRGFIPADVVIVAAGGFNTPVILDDSGIKTDQKLFVDPVLCVAAQYKNAFQNKELPMPFAVQMKGYIISPYFDQLSFFFNKRWRFPGKDILSLMIKLSDSNEGNPKDKRLTAEDKNTLENGIEQCRHLLSGLGIKPADTFLGTLNAGHPGGMLPLTKNEAASFHNPRLPDNVYVADASLFPASLGNPPMLTIMAMAKRISGIILEKK
jgi:choline dehydrogenase-like flavoprotein